MNRKSVTWAVLVLVAAAGATRTLAEPTVKVGTQAPRLQTGNWVQGEPVRQLEKGKAYIVEFWATWCGPCKVSIPHLNEIYQKYKDRGLVVIGQDCWENDEKLVAPFVKSMGEKMTYRVALDNKASSKSGAMCDAWMTAGEKNGIPCAFLVDKNGVIAWIGHPMSLQGSVIEDVLAGKYDLRAAAVEYDKQHKKEMEQQEAFKQIRADVARFHELIGKKDYRAAYQLAAQLSDSHRENAWLQNELAWTIAADKSIQQRDLALAETIATRANDAAKGRDEATLDTLARILFMRERKAEAIKLEEQAVALAGGDEKKRDQKIVDSYRKGVLPDPD